MENYDKIILELLSRIQTLEEAVGIKIAEKGSTGGSEAKALFGQNLAAKNLSAQSPKMNTAKIKEYILQKLEAAEREGEPHLDITAGQLHKELNLKNAVPMVCNAIRACMKQGDYVLFRSPSGYSSTLKVRYIIGVAEPQPILMPKGDFMPDLPGLPDFMSGLKTEGVLQASQKEASPPARAALKYIDPNEVWARILDFEGNFFFTDSGEQFVYATGSDYLAIRKTSYKIPRADIEKAVALYPFKNSVPLQHLRHPSYIYAILTDERIIAKI